MLYSVLGDPKIKAKRFDDGLGNRFYYFEKNKRVEVAAGITTVFHSVMPSGREIEKWKELNPNWKELLDKSASYGTTSHELYADIMMNKPITPSLVNDMIKTITSIGGSPSTPKKDILSFMKWTEDVKLKPLVIEGVLVWTCPNTGAHLAMTIDLLAEAETTTSYYKTVDDGVYKRGAKKGQSKTKRVKVTETKKEIVQVDFKSNFFEKDSKKYYDSHKMQLIGAARAVYQNFGIKVDKMFNWSPNNWRKEPTYTYTAWDITQKDIDIWEAYWKLAVLLGKNKPEGSIFVSNLQNSSDFSFMSYPEYAQKFLLNQNS